MTKSLIVTITDETNYGNRLQNYALNSLLMNYGSCDTAEFVLGVSDRRGYIRARMNGIKRLMHLRNVKVMFQCLMHPQSMKYRLIRKRLDAMARFTDRYIPYNKYRITEFRNLEIKNKDIYDTVVLGSDQIWNYRWLSLNELRLRLGSFAKTDVKVISYAASFGIESIDSEDACNIFEKYLPKLRAISVREDRGKELVEELAHVPATVVLDPTLMLTSEQWKRVTSSFVATDDRYVLTYFLGKPSPEQQQCIDEYARAHNCRVRKILYLGDPETYIAGPGDFVELFAKAQYVFTDSYHACCFSILFHKQFTVFTRSGLSIQENMNSRMETLFRLFQLDSVVMDSGIAPVIDYDKVDRLLEQHRVESRAWLDAAMER